MVVQTLRVPGMVSVRSDRNPLRPFSVCIKQQKITLFCGSKFPHHKRKISSLIKIEENFELELKMSNLSIEIRDTNYAKDDFLLLSAYVKIFRKT